MRSGSACGAPIWAPVGLVDAVRIGRDIGVSWKGHYSAESLLRDQTARNFANGILWQADPDCILLRDRFHDLIGRAGAVAGAVRRAGRRRADDERSARRSAAGAAQLFSRSGRRRRAFACDFPLLGQAALRHGVGTGPTGRPMMVSEGDPVLVQRVRRADGSVLLNVFNTGDLAADRLIPWALAGFREPAARDRGRRRGCHDRRRGCTSALGPHQSRQLEFAAS